MIHGPDVAFKYGVIVAGRKKELAADKDPNPEELLEFLDSIRHGTRNEFEEWYQLYK